MRSRNSPSPFATSDTAFAEEDCEIQRTFSLEHSLPGSWFREPYAGEPLFPHSDDTQVAPVVFGARFQGEQADVPVRPHSFLVLAQVHPERKVLCISFHGNLGLHHRVRDCCSTLIEERSVRANNLVCQLAHSQDGHTHFGCLHGIPPSTCRFVFLCILHSRRALMLHNFVTGSRNPLCKHGSVFLFSLFSDRLTDASLMHASVQALKCEVFSRKGVRPAEVSRFEALRRSLGASHLRFPMDGSAVPVV